MTLLLSTSILITLHLYCAAAQSQCTTADVKSGKCISIYDCSSLLKLIADATPAEEKLLKSSFCNFIGDTHWECCPPDTCVTPNDVEGACIGTNLCTHLADMLHSKPLGEVKQYALKSRCGDSEENKMCCGPQPKPIPKPMAGEVQECQLTAFPPDSSSECCGVDASGGGNRIVGGNVTSVDEYPWLAMIEYVNDQFAKFVGGGVLISGQYVVTAAHCVVGPMFDVQTVKVRLGEYDTSNPGADCVEVGGGGMDCNDGPITVPVEKIISHPGYKPDSKLRRQDIALIRLDRIVEYTDFIRPICLPTADFTTAIPGDVMLYAAGWGIFSDEQSASNIKLKVGLPYVSHQDCQQSYNVQRRRMPLWGGQICAGGMKGQDSCKGDSGGPLMKNNGGIYELVGIVSFGPSPCGMENVPSVYSKVFHYLQWIQSQIVA